MIDYKFLILSNTCLLFFARFTSSIVLYMHSHFMLAYFCLASALISMFGIVITTKSEKFYNNLLEKHFFSNKYKTLLQNKQYFLAKIFKRIARVEFLHLRLLVWHSYQLEIMFFVFSAFYFGWGWGFELFLITLSSYFYLNLKKYHKAIFLFPITYFLIYVITYLFSPKISADGQIIVYLINAVTAMTCIFITQIVIQLGNIIQFISYKNREARINKLASFDTLTNTYHKYSFLEIMSNKYEYCIEDKTTVQASILIFEIYNLKEINEEFTTELGNEILKEFVHILKKYSENYDNYMVRWSGNEILVLIINENEAVIRNYIKEIRQEAAKNRFGIKDAKLKIAIGETYVNEFDYQINDYIKEAYIKLVKSREKLNFN